MTTSQSWFQNRSQIFVSGTRSARFEIEKRPLSLLFLTSEEAFSMPKMKIWFQKLFWNQDCDVVNNLVVEVAIYNFDLFHCTLVGVCCRVGHPGFFQRHFWFMCIYKRISEWKCTQNAVMRKSKYIQINLIFGCWYVIVGKRVGNGTPPPTPVALFPSIPLPYFFSQLNPTYETDFTLCPSQIYHF